MSSPPPLTLTTLTPELLLAILSHLPYEDLKQRIPLVCRLFHALLQRPSATSSTPIDKALFRDCPTTAATTAHPKLHPFLDAIRYRFSPSLDSIYVAIPDTSTANSSPPSGKLLKLSLRHENICSPAVRRAVYHMRTFVRREPEVNITGSGNGGSVTIIDVFRGVAEDAIAGEKWESVNAYSLRWDGFERWDVDKEGVLHLWDEPH